MCRLHHKGRSGLKRGCKVRQDIYEEVCSKKENIVKHSWPKIWVATLWCKMEIDVPSSPQGVAVAKYRSSKQTEHLEKNKDQNDETAVKHKVAQLFGHI